MNDFEKLLKEHAKLAALLDDERGYLRQLEMQFRSIEQRLKDFVKPSPCGFVLTPESSENVPANWENEVAEAAVEVGASALEQAALAVADLGDGVSAEQLAEHLEITRDAARLRLQRAAKEGLIIRIASGRYRFKRISARGPQEAETGQKVASEIRPDATANGVVTREH
jgi:biotin operon repressor